MAKSEQRNKTESFKAEKEEAKKMHAKNSKIESCDLATKDDGCKIENCGEMEDYLAVAQRIQAEFDNYRKRSAETFKSLKQDGVIEAVAKFLPALDSIQKAKTMIKDKSVLEGIFLIEKELKNSLEALEIEEIKTEKQHYNPKYHNVIAVINDNSLENGIITDVYQVGYKIKDKIIRYAQVIVNKNKEDQNE